MKALAVIAICGSALAACGSDTPAMAHADCEGIKVACGGGWLVGTNCEDPMRRECIETATSCGQARWCGMGPLPDSGVPGPSWEEIVCGTGCRGCSRGTEGRCDPACVAGPIQECINRATSCDAIENCLIL